MFASILEPGWTPPLQSFAGRVKTPESISIPAGGPRGKLEKVASDRRHLRRADTIATANLQYADSIIIKKIGWIPEESGALIENNSALEPPRAGSD